jgi:hypothetical protein
MAAIRTARIRREWVLTLSIGLSALVIVIAVIVALVKMLP